MSERPGDARPLCGSALHIAPHQDCRYVRGSRHHRSAREPMPRVAVQPQIVTSARMAAGMTSRARRPETHPFIAG
jgi:hypothetical protein